MKFKFTGKRITICLGIAVLIGCFCDSSTYAMEKRYLKIGVPLSNPAFYFHDDRENLFQGYSIDVLNILCKNMSVQPRFLVGRDEDLLNALSNGVIDMVCGVAHNQDPRDKLSYLEISIYIKRYTYSHTPENPSKVLLPRTSKTIVMVGENDYLESRLLVPNVNLMRAQSIKDALFLVNSGTAQEYVCYSDRLTSYIIGEYALQNVRLSSVAISRFPLNLITNKDNNELAARINLALGKAIQDGELDKVREKWLGDDYLSYLWERYGIWVTIGILLFLIMFVGVATWNQTLKAKVCEITNELQLSEERYRQLIESSPDFVFLLDRHGHIKMTNKSMVDFFDVSPRKRPLININEIVHGEDQAKCDTFLKQLFTERSASIEIRLKSKKKRQIYVEVAAAMLRMGKQNERLGCCFARDLTTRKRIEMELIKSDRLSTIGKMAAGVAHEVNNPLGIISAHAEDLLSGELNPTETIDSLNIIRRNANRAAGIIEALLGQASSIPSKMTLLDLAEILDGCINFLRPRMKNINLEANYLQGLYWIKGDEGQLQQIFINLLLNSIESTKNEGSIKIKIETKTIKKNDLHCIKIEDDGRGIEANDKDRIFEPFFTKGKVHGVGLGLFVSERIIKMHHGSITAVDSSLGGAAFMVLLPAEKRE